MTQNGINLYVYNQSFSLIAIIDKYSSLIWTDRYNDCGEFELSVPYESKWKSIFKKDYLCKIDFSDHWCFIEKVEINSDEETAAMVTVSGRSIESMLERRIVIGKREFGTDDIKVGLYESIRSLINENIINPSNSKRRISNFVFKNSNESAITSLTFSESYEGTDLLDVITGVCHDKHIGFQILVNSSNNYEFSFFVGKDRSRSSNSTGYVIFSPYYDNLVTSNYFSSTEDYRNVMVIQLEDDAYTSIYNTDSEPSGLSRREVYESDSKMDDVELTEKELNNKLTIELKKTSTVKSQIRSKAIKKLKRDYRIKTGFEGNIIPEKMYKYRTNYNVGDKVQFEDFYGNNDRVYISEVVISYDENGLSILPTFEEIDWE